MHIRIYMLDVRVIISYIYSITNCDKLQIMQDASSTRQDAMIFAKIQKILLYTLHFTQHTHSRTWHQHGKSCIFGEASIKNKSNSIEIPKIHQKQSRRVHKSCPYLLKKEPCAGCSTLSAYMFDYFNWRWANLCMW